MREVLKALRPVRARLRRNRLLRGAAAGLAAGLGAAALLQGVSFFVPVPDRGLLAAEITAATAAVTALGNALRPVKNRDAARAADVLEQMGKTNIRLIVNRISKKMASAMGLTVDDVMDRAGLPLLGIVPEDQNVVLAAAFRQPLLGYTSKGAAAACRRIAKRLQGMTVPILNAIKK